MLKKFNKFVFKDFSFYCQSKKFNRLLSRAITTSNVSQSAQHDYVVKSPLPPLNYPKVSIDQYIWADYEKWINKVAIVDGITDRSITYGELRDKCRALAIRLRTSFNLQRNDTIALCLPNSIEFPIVALGGSEAELTVTTINPIYTSEEISRQLISSNAKLLFGDVSMSSIFKHAISKAKRNIKIVYVTNSPSESIPADGIRLSELIETRGLDLMSLPETERDIDAVSFLPYSSGTTGLNKGVMLSHWNIVTNSLALRSAELQLAADTTPDNQDVIPCVLPFFHAYGLVVTLLAKLAQGCKLVTVPRFHPETFLSAMEKYPGTALHLAPPMIIFFNNYEKIRPKHTRSIRYVVSGAAPLGSSDIEKFLKISPQTQYIQAYGLTEASPVTHMSAKSSTNYASIGDPIHDTECKVVDINDPEFRGLGPNQTGEVLIRGPQIMLGYHNNETATKDTVTSDGWLRTGDIGYHDEQGNFYITDRLKELIKVKGFQVAPAELEEILRMHPDIADAAVIGVPNPATGELPRAFVVAKKGSKISEKSVQEYVAQRVSDYKKLAGGVEFVDTIPKNTTGKILRRELKSRYV
ncbi:unnamed protein product [Chironomus riparius]|uniref:Uncharacterized protein n=1 Tax=Chironomus riparius TaxID=315576 RepID=A0A9N9S598_9DIPT|nr:unnamed protein product [Chironomus riparius]